ncbi:hypothetical protein, partial [Psychrobacter sp. TB20-MNA-CIBAN-0197]|uniref:hypothetical protein n=1 Tax=Psychrobacter sp. TB20-MNA-CIBAN-0197 TaxID=3140453 RepID=UPI0033231DF6
SGIREPDQVNTCVGNKLPKMGRLCVFFYAHNKVIYFLGCKVACTLLYDLSLFLGISDKTTLKQ